jgi:conjugal transfer/entry exclusion protein
MKRFYLAVSVACLAISTSQPAHAQGIPVMDLSSIAQEIKSYAMETQAWETQNLQWLKQVQQYTTQAEQYATETEQLIAFVHNPSIGAAAGLLNMTGLGNSLPVSPNSLMALLGGANAIGNGSFNLGTIAGIAGTLSNLGGSVYAANHVYSPTDNSWISQQLINNGNSLDGEQGTALAAYQDYQSHAANLTALRAQVSASTNPLDMAAVQAQIAVEQTWTENENGKVQAAQMAAWTQVQLRQQANDEKFTQSMDNQATQARAVGINIP